MLAVVVVVVVPDGMRGMPFFDGRVCRRNFLCACAVVVFEHTDDEDGGHLVSSQKTPAVATKLSLSGGFSKFPRTAPDIFFAKSFYRTCSHHNTAQKQTWMDAITIVVACWLSSRSFFCRATCTNPVGVWRLPLLVES